MTKVSIGRTVALVLGFTGAAEAWEHRINGTYPAWSTTTNAVVAPDGDVAVAGFTSGVGVFVIKRSAATGAEIWRHELRNSPETGSVDDDDAPPALAVDATGNVVLGVTSRFPGNGAVVTVLDLDGASGDALWRRDIDLSTEGDEWGDRLQSVAVDSRGDVVVACRNDAFEEVVLKLDGRTGAELWRVSDSRFHIDAPVITDGDGDVVLGGSLEWVRDWSQWDFAVRKLSGSTGAMLWEFVQHGSAVGLEGGISPGVALGVGVDADGDVLAGGLAAYAATNGDLTAVKLEGATGNPIWWQAINGVANLNEEAERFVVDSAGNAFITGTLCDAIEQVIGGRVCVGRSLVMAFAGATGAQLWAVEGARFGWQIVGDGAGGVHAFFPDGYAMGVARLDGTGDEPVWRRTIEGVHVGEGAPIVVDGGGRVLVGGWQAPEAAVLISLDAETGDQVWRADYHADVSTAFDEAYAAAATPDGAVAVAGTLGNPTGSGDFAVFSFDLATGQERWRTVVDGVRQDDADAARTVAVDAAGDVVAGGALATPTSTTRDGSFGVVKVAGADGTERWRWTSGGSGQARATMITPQGDVVAGGVIDGGPAVVLLQRDAGSPIWSFAAQGGAIHALARDGQGAVFAAGKHASRGTVARLDEATGVLAWAVPIGDDWGEVRAITVDAHGDVIAAGLRDAELADSAAVVVKLRGSDGAELWRWEKRIYSRASASTLALLPDGHVIVGATFQYETYAYDAVFALEASTGTERWQWWDYGSARGAAIRAVEVDGAGDVLVAGGLGERPGDSYFTVLKLDGTSGTEQWRRRPTSGIGRAEALVLADLDVILAAGFATGTAPATGHDVFVTALNAGGVAWPCGDGVLDAGEACDDGNGRSDDGCTAACVVNLCGDGLLDRGTEECDDGNELDGDFCHADCTLTQLCVNGVSMAQTRLDIVQRRGRIVLSGVLVVPPGADFNPTALGAQVSLEESAPGGRLLFDRSHRTVTIPPGAGCKRDDGWKGTGPVFAYRNRSGSLDAPRCTPWSAQGLGTVWFKDERPTRGTVRFKVTARGGVGLLPTGAIQATIVWGATAADSRAGRCGVHTFAATRCTVVADGLRLRCQ